MLLKDERYDITEFIRVSHLYSYKFEHDDDDDDDDRNDRDEDDCNNDDDNDYDNNLRCSIFKHSKIASSFSMFY